MGPEKRVPPRRTTGARPRRHASGSPRRHRSGATDSATPETIRRFIPKFVLLALLGLLALVSWIAASFWEPPTRVWAVATSLTGTFETHGLAAKVVMLSSWSDAPGGTPLDAFDEMPESWIPGMTTSDDVRTTVRVTGVAGFLARLGFGDATHNVTYRPTANRTGDGGTTWVEFVRVRWGD